MVKYVEWNKFCMYEHMGTHMDAPSHFSKDGNNVEQVDLASLVGEACVIDIRAKTAKNASYALTVADIKEWERVNGAIDSGCIVLLCTGLSAHYHDKKRYFNTNNVADASTYRFSSFGPGTGAYLRDASVKAIGVDAISIDAGGRGFPVHLAILQAGIPGFENMNNLHRLPARGATIFAAPTLIKGGSGAPLRAFAVGWQDNDACSIENMSSANSGTEVLPTWLVAAVLTLVYLLV